MDVRVFPFSFPPIKGGAQGGDSPTPTPPPVVNYYDLSGVTFRVVPSTAEGDWISSVGDPFPAAVLRIQGIAPLDVTDVASLEFVSGFTSITADGVEMKEDAKFSNVVRTVTYTGSAVAMVNSDYYNRAVMTADNWDATMAGKTAGGQVFVTMTAYDANGNALQTKTWTALIT